MIAFIFSFIYCLFLYVFVYYNYICTGNYYPRLILDKFAKAQSFDPLVASNWYSWNQEKFVEHCEVFFFFLFHKTKIINKIKIVIIITAC